MDEAAKKLDDPPVMAGRHRREGFPGQHHVVLPAPVVASQRDHPLLRGLFVTDAGQYPHAQGHLVTRASGTGGFIMIVCSAGLGWVRTRGEHHEVGTGDVVLLRPRVPHSYGAASADPWTIEWAHFSGSEADDWLNSIAGNGCHLKLHPTASVSIRLSRVHEHLEAGYDETQLLLASAALRRSLAELVRLRRTPNHAPTSVEAVEATAEWMRGHLSSPVTLADLAKKSGMSPSQYSAIFRQRFGFPPIDWFTRQRVRQACRLLDLTREKVEVVGLEVGFRDPYYFSRSFRKVMGCSPRAYRAIAKG
ncbi:MAG: helix-turn-helix domain-containing protein [Luteolibacter sp.]